MAASCTAQLSLSLAHGTRWSGHASSSGPAPMSLNLKSHRGFVPRCSALRHSGAIVAEKGSGDRRKRSGPIVGARRPGKDRDGALAQAVPEIKVPDNPELDDMYMGKKLEGLEPDFWEGEKWDVLGFIVQYLWAFGVLVSLVACGVAVTSYNSGAVDIRETDVFKEALENQVDADSSFDSDSFQDFPETSEAPPLE